MWSKLGACLLLLLALAPSRGDESLVKTSNDERIRITLLYVGPIHDVQNPEPFVICYLIEDNRSDEDLQRHPWKGADGNVADQQYYLAPSIPQLKDANRQVMKSDGPERARMYATAQLALFKAAYPNVVLPTIDHPEHGQVYEYFYKTAPTGPFDIEMYDHMPGYGTNLFHFRDVAAGTTFSP